MKLRQTLLSAALVTACSLSGWAVLAGQKIGVVIALRGNVQIHHSNGASVQENLKLLGVVRGSDDLTLDADSQVTISVLATGTRYTIKGPYKNLKVPDNGAFKPSPGSITEIRETGNAGVVASQAFDRTAMGGSSSRIAAIPILTDLDQPLIPMSKFTVQPKPDARGRIEIWYAPDAMPWEKSHATIVEVQGKTFVKADRIVPAGQAYLLSTQVAEPTELKEAEVRVARYSKKDLTGIQRLTREHRTQDDWMELYGAYLELHLFERARAALAQMQNANPGATDWNQITAQLDLDQEESERHGALENR